MDFTIDVPDGGRGIILEAADRGVDPFGLRPTHRDQTPRIPDAIKRGIAAPNEEGCRIMAEDLAARGVSLDGVDALTARLIRHAGVEPLSAIWIASLGNGMDKLQRNGVAIVDIDLRMRCSSYDNMTRIHLSPDVVWHAYGLIFLPIPPATVMATVEGTPLKNILSHPVLDRYDLRIEEINDEARKGDVGLQVDVEHEDLTPEGLLEMSAQWRASSGSYSA